MSRSGRANRRSRSATIAGPKTARRSPRVCPERSWRSAICLLAGSAIAAVPGVAGAQQLALAGTHVSALVVATRGAKKKKARKRTRDDDAEDRDEGADGREAPEAAQKAYAAGLEARDRGEYEEAASQFYTAFELLPAEPRERRAAVLFDLVAARRSAYEEKGDTAQLCASSRVLDAYIKEEPTSAGGEVDRDARKARELRAMVQADVELLQDMEPGLDCDKLRVEGEPPPSETGDEAPSSERGEGELDGRRLTIAGAVTTGVGALLLGATVTGVVIYARANSEQQALIDSGGPIPAFTLDEIAGRERLGAGLAIGGGVLAGAALGAGITMLVVGRRAGANPRMSFAPFLTPRVRGVALGMRF